MNWPLIRSIAIKYAPLVIGVALGVGGTKAVETKTVPQAVKVECKCVVPKPDPIKVELIK